MPEVIDPIIINQGAIDIVITMAVLGDSPDTPLARGFEYRAYHELVQMLLRAYELPADYPVVTPDARLLRDWLMTGKGLERRFSEETLHLFAQIQSAGGSSIDDICRFYCKWKGTKELAMAGVDLFLVVPNIAAILAEISLFAVLPPAALIGILLHGGVYMLDKCDCKAYGDM